jgi:hypothetical protein|nr:hypothetical protein [Neorhizobium tomejilense]
MASRSDIERLEQRYSRWSGLHSVLVVPAALAALFTLPLSIAYQSMLHPLFAAGPVMLISLVLYGQYRAQKWETSTRRVISAHYHDLYNGTTWTTPASAEGVVVEVKSFGNYLTLAFPSGVTQTYARSSLTPKA